MGPNLRARLRLAARSALGLAALALPGSAQEAPPAGTAGVVAAASEEARGLWERVCAASGAATRAPLTAFALEADVRTRSGMQRNDAHIDYRYLAPDCIRFMLPSRNETGRFGPAPEQYWLRSGDQVVPLAGREYKEDRRAVDDMIALAKNYVALSNPARLTLTALEIPEAPPADLGVERAKRARKLRWLALESPDFALVRSEVASPRGTVYRVELGIASTDLPAMAIVRAPATPGVEPLLVEFSNYRESEDFRIPYQLFVFARDPAQTPPAFADAASQEVYVTTASLRPPLTPDDFRPKP